MTSKVRAQQAESGKQQRQQHLQQSAQPTFQEEPEEVTDAAISRLLTSSTSDKVQMSNSLPARQAALGEMNSMYGNRHVQRLLSDVGNDIPHIVQTQQTESAEKFRLSKNNPIIRIDNRMPAATNMVSLREATWLERRAWLAFFDHYLPRKFLQNYMDDTGAALTLTQQEMIDCNPVIDIRRSEGFRRELASLRSAGGGIKAISVTGWGGAMTNGTLGNFTVNYAGTLTVAADGTWSFSGTMHFYDYWDFDPKPFNSNSGRPIFAEIRVRAAAYGLPGQAFEIHSATVTVSQTNNQTRAVWATSTPVAVTGPMARTAADIGTGAEVGVGGGPEMEVGGGEAGAQSSEDLNP